MEWPKNGLILVLAKEGKYWATPVEQRTYDGSLFVPEESFSVALQELTEMAAEADIKADA